VSTVSIWRFDTSDGAEAALRALERLQVRRAVVIDDAAVLVWGDGERRPHGYQVGSADGFSALSGASWGLLFGLLFLLPLAGVADDAVLVRFGLSDRFLAHARDRITVGTSALFLFTDRAAVDRLRGTLSGADPLVCTLDQQHEIALRRAFDAGTDIGRRA
jgi:uncharacterized membrane protein